MLMFSDGLIRGHAYSLTKVVTASTLDGLEVHLVRIRNPWGNEVEWNGPWSDQSEEWANISEVNLTETLSKNNYHYEFLVGFLKNVGHTEI
jgi:calpain